MADLFENEESVRETKSPEIAADAPLATRMRPRDLSEYVGQEHILAEGCLLRRAIEADHFTSLLFYGPPGVGKTSLAELIARQTASRFKNLSGVESSVADVRKAVEEARTMRQLHDKTTILFVDEIHRFNKSQQDVLLPHIERGTVRFIGATTHNPSFYVNGPLVSRSQLFQLEPLEDKALLALLGRALEDSERGFGGLPVDLADEAAEHIARLADGDARKALNALELAVSSTAPGKDGRIAITLAVAEQSVQRKMVVYDRDGDNHYDTISAFIKSIRGSDPDAALYWLAKMLVAGEDPRFIARRLVISASEDIGMADSNGLRVAMAAQQAFEVLGMPEGRIPLAHATVYLATAPKSNRAYMGLNAAVKDVKSGRTLAVPVHLRTPTRKKMARASELADEAAATYHYSHDGDDAYIPQAYLPEGRRYYEPGTQGMERRVKERLDHWRKLFAEGRAEDQGGPRQR